MEALKINIEKSTVPIVWLDTSVITNMTIFRLMPDKLDVGQRERIGNLYNRIHTLSREGKIICPLAEQEGEIWINRKEWMETIHDLSLGIECVGFKEIQDSQLSKAMEAFVHKQSSICLSYKDAFFKDPVEELKEILQEPVFVAVDYDILGGADYRRESNAELIRKLNESRECNVRDGISFKQQKQTEVEGEIRAVVAMTTELMGGKVEDERDEFNKIAALINLSEQLYVWKHYTGRENDLSGLVEFHRSNYNTSTPYIDLSTSLYAKIMTDPQPIKSGDPMDITHIATSMPYSDLFITDKHWSTFLRNQSYDEKYGSVVAYIGDTEIIEKFFEPISWH